MITTFKRALLFLFLTCMLVSCEERTITDPSTEIEIPTVKAADHNLVIRFSNDGMVGFGNYEREELVVALNFYKNHSLQRGDVVYINNPEYRSKNTLDHKPDPTIILRVIGLPEETIHISSGQVFIDGKRLDTFYGKPPGPTLDELKKQEKDSSALAQNDIQNLRYHIHNYENDHMDSVRVPKGSVFLLADNRLRIADSELYGPVSKEDVLGRVMGYLEKHEWEKSPTFNIPFHDAASGKNDLALRGEKGRFALVDQPIMSGKPYQNYLFFWGKPEELQGVPQIIAVRQNHDTNRRVVFAAGGVSGPIANADGHIPPSNMTIPEPGLWRLEAYLGERYFGSVVVEVL